MLLNVYVILYRCRYISTTHIYTHFRCVLRKIYSVYYVEHYLLEIVWTRGFSRTKKYLSTICFMPGTMKMREEPLNQKKLFLPSKRLQYNRGNKVYMIENQQVYDKS